MSNHNPLFVTPAPPYRSIAANGSPHEENAVENRASGLALPGDSGRRYGVLGKRKRVVVDSEDLEDYISREDTSDQDQAREAVPRNSRSQTIAQSIEAEDEVVFMEIRVNPEQAQRLERQTRATEQREEKQRLAEEQSQKIVEQTRVHYAKILYQAADWTRFEETDTKLRDAARLAKLESPAVLIRRNENEWFPLLHEVRKELSGYFKSAAKYLKSLEYDKEIEKYKETIWMMRKEMLEGMENGISEIEVSIAKLKKAVRKGAGPGEVKTEKKERAQGRPRNGRQGSSATATVVLD